MILFVFEGETREPALFNTMGSLFPIKGHHICCSYGNNIYNLYRKLKEDQDEELISVLHNSAKGKDPYFWAHRREIDEIYLFFDYDKHDQSASDTQLQEMLEMFDNETDKGKLYINYPMVESLFYIKEMPDPYFNEYTVALQNLPSFKELCGEFNAYKSSEFCTLPKNLKSKAEKVQKTCCEKCRKNWEFLRQQNVQKAHWLCTQQMKPLTEIPKPLSQKEIFRHQIADYVNAKQEVSVLNAFPIFLFEYFKT
ncbi:MAG: hypothetical protein M0P13_11655 [Fibrobacteraceae bacterium]|nr:hypothetical protein [Fibrobacteraceae bacterium]